MSQPRMCGVVLWSSRDEGRAVIWCEDHGNLAFYKANDSAHRGVSLDPGDLIDFDLVDDPFHRVAENPRLLVEHHSPHIVSGLKQTTHVVAAQCVDDRPAAATEPKCNVIKLPRRRPARPRATVSVA